MMKFDGIEKIEINSNGDLEYFAANEKFIEYKPFTFYTSGGNEIISSYSVIDNNKVVFNIDINNIVEDEIVIDPVLTWSTYFQGVYGGYQGDPGVDNDGNIYICTQEGAGTLPVLNAGSGQWYQGTTSGISPNWDLAIFKFNFDLSLDWCTFYGGLACEEGWGKRNVAIDNTNNRIYFSGETDTPYSNSTQTFPTYDPGNGAFYQDASFDNESSYPFFLEFTHEGVRNWATFFTYETAPFSGGMGTDVESIYFRNGYLYFAGETNKYSHSGIPLRTLAGAYNNSYWPGDGSHVYCGRFNSNRVLEWCTYVNNNVATTSFSGNVADMVVDANNNIYIVTDYSEYSASKLSNVLPLVNPGGAYYVATGGLGYGSRRGTHITKLNPASSSVIWGTFHSGGYGDLPAGCEVDGNNNLYVAYRSVGSTDFPTLDQGGGAYYQAAKYSVCNTGPNDYANGGKDGAIAKFSSAGVRLWSTYINGTNPTSGETGVVDIDAFPTGDIMMSSKTVTPDFPVQFVAGSYNKSTLTTAGTYESVFTKFNSAGVIQWSSYFHGLYAYGSIQNNGCFSKYIVDNGGGSTIPMVDPGAPAYFSSTIQNYQSFQIFEDAVSGQSTAPSSIDASQTSVCGGNSVSLTVNGGSLGTGAAWQWYSGSCGGTSAGTGNSISVTPSTTTTYYVQAVGTCNSTACVYVTITVADASTAATSINASETSICSGTNITLTVNGGSLGTGAVWQWYSGTCGGNSEGSGNSINVTPMTTTTYFVQAVGTCNTTACVSQTITVNSVPLQPDTITGPVIICQGDNNISFTADAIAGATSYTWTLPSGFTGSSSTNSITVNIGTAAVSGDVTVYATNACGDGPAFTLPVIVSSLSTDPTSITASFTSICSGDSVVLTVNGGSLGAGAEWTWYENSCGSGTAIGTGSSISVYPASTIVYFVRAEGACNNTSCITIVITVFPAMNLTATSTDESCGGSNGTAQVIVSGGSVPFSYLWSNDSTTYIMTGLSEGNYSVTVTDINNCTSDASVYVSNSGSSLNTSISGIVTPLCFGYSGGSATVNASGTGPFDFIWSNGDTTATTSGISAGIYFVTVSDQSGCSGIDSVEITQPSALAYNDSIINISCYGFDDGRIYPNVSGGTPAYSYIWIGPNSFTSVASYLTGLSAGGYYVTITDANGCSVSGIEFSVSEPEKPVTIDITVNSPDCYNSNDGIGTAIVTGGTPPYTYLWSSSGTGSSVSNLGSGQYYLTVSDDNSCIVIDTFLVSSPAQITANETITNASCTGNNEGEIVLSCNGGTKPYTFVWNTEPSQNDSSANNLLAGNYSVTISDFNNCTEVFNYTVSESSDDCLDIPNVFTPNGDGVNDTWELIGIQIYPEVKIEIFNRWGDVIYTYSGSGSGYKSLPWDGTFNEKELPISSYIYVVELNNDNEPYNGIVTIKK
ncbi:MAG: gliding motility-associated C-terminal domain-containing protein [Bacteroidota bacterium]